jgi:hypothetical protein
MNAADMSEAEFRAWCDRIDETPQRRAGGRVIAMEDAAEYRARARGRPRRNRLADRLMQLDEQAVRMQQSDRNLRDLGLL